tara:strand:- start:243 stop:620 length:378 start_codon:yes stop_codon:yes gene_type:complete
MIWKYDEEEYNTWVAIHEKWMRENLPVQMVESFEGEVEALVSDKDRHGFMLFHLLHMSTLNNNDDYEYWEQAQDIWNLALPLLQAFNTMMMGLANRAGDERTLHAIGLANALMMEMFSPRNTEEE